MVPLGWTTGWGRGAARAGQVALAPAAAGVKPVVAEFAGRGAVEDVDRAVVVDHRVRHRAGGQRASEGVLGPAAARVEPVVAKAARWGAVENVDRAVAPDCGVRAVVVVVLGGG